MFKQTMIKINVCEVFREAELEFDISIEQHWVRFNEEQLRGIHGFQKI
jgi:hypothetical protein